MTGKRVSEVGHCYYPRHEIWCGGYCFMSSSVKMADGGRELKWLASLFRGDCRITLWGLKLSEGPSLCLSWLIGICALTSLTSKIVSSWETEVNIGAHTSSCPTCMVSHTHRALPMEEHVCMYLCVCVCMRLCVCIREKLAAPVSWFKSGTVCSLEVSQYNVLGAEILKISIYIDALSYI